jgi:hypothetical protein
MCPASLFLLTDEPGQSLVVFIQLDRLVLVFAGDLALLA